MNKANLAKYDYNIPNLLRYLIKKLKKKDKGLSIFMLNFDQKKRNATQLMLQLTKKLQGYAASLQH